MVCRKPFVKGVVQFGCGQCTPCRISLRRLWTHRLLLESFSHKQSSFVTLTYEDSQLPFSLSGLPTLVKKHLQDWLKKLRKEVDLRYYYVGEYSPMGRPHYHLCLYGIDCLDPIGRRQRGNLQALCPCSVCNLIRKKWGFGRISVDEFSMETAQYVAGYVTKKLTQPDNPRNYEYRAKHKTLLRDRAPEFGQPSLKPGIGALSLGPILDSITTTAGCDRLARDGDVPLSLRHGKKILPLGRYIRRKLREAYGFKETGSQAGWEKEIFTEMQLMREMFEADPQNAGKSFYSIQGAERLQKVRNIENKHSISRGGNLK